MPLPTRSSARLEKLRLILEGATTLLIVMQNNPDPDAIAAAAALREIANELEGIACSLTHGGTVGRAENLAMLRYLGVNPRPIETLDPTRFGRIAIVDAQPGTGNVSLDPAIRPDIVIDHHPVRPRTRSVPFTDIRRRYGATSTILWEYLDAAGITIEPRLATALVYGIRSDTQDLGRETTRADIEAFLALYPMANPRALGRIVAAPLPRIYFARLRSVLDSAVVYGHSVVASVSPLDTPEMVAEAADLLLRVEGVSWVLCYGVIGEWLHLSLRTSDREPAAGTIARHLAGRRGYGGGHQALAGAQIPLSPAQRAKPARNRFIRGIVTRFLRATGTAAAAAEPLCEPMSDE